MISTKSKEKSPARQDKPKSKSGFKFGAIAILTGAGTTMLLGLWLGLMLLLDPNSILWLNRFLPRWSHVPIALSNPLQDLAEVETELQQEGLSLGAPLYLGDEMIVPVWQRLSDCTETSCEAIAALRVYFIEKSPAGSERYSLLTELKLGTITVNYFSDFKLLPRNNDQTNYWLSVEGITNNSNFVTGDRYGLFLHYDPYEKQLVNLLSWRSAAGKSPYWEQILGSQDLELVVDQSRNLEPTYDVFQVIRRHRKSRLKAIDLDVPALDLPVYQTALNLAQLKLWAIAEGQLIDIKQTLDAKQWTTAAEEQLQLVHYHSQTSTKKCESSTLNIGQTINYCLQAGDVNEALRLLENHFDDPLVVSTVVAFLEADNGNLKGRLEALHKLDPFRDAVTLWQFLALTAEQGSQTAIASLKQQQQIDEKLQAKIQKTLERVEVALSKQTRPLSADSKLLGKLRPAGSIQVNQWLQPEGEAIALDPNKNWHILTVERFFDGRLWQTAPFNLDVSNFVPGQSLWQTLGLEKNAVIHVGTADLQQPSNIAFGQVRGAKVKNGQLKLLVEGQQKLGDRRFAFSPSAIRWLTPNTLSLNDLSAVETRWTDLILQNLWQHLRANNVRFESEQPDLATLKSEFGALQVSPIELTGNNHAEARVTFYLNETGELAFPNVLDTDNSETEILTEYHLIFADTGDLLYSDLQRTNKMKLGAIADLQDGGTAVLVFQDPQGNTNLKRWDDIRRVFVDL